MGVVNISCKELFRKKVIEGKFDLKVFFQFCPFFFSFLFFSLHEGQKPTKDDLQATKTECSLSKKGSYGSLEFRVCFCLKEKEKRMMKNRFNYFFV